MGFWDIGETIMNAVSPWADDAVKNWTVEDVPVLGNIINAAQGVYHVGAGAYDAATGDRDGAITHGVQGAFNVLGAIPGVKDVLGGVDKGLGAAGGAGKLLGEATDNSFLKEAPQSCSDVATMQTLYAVNSIFGKDDDNWFYDDPEVQGTRGGEVRAGVKAMASAAGPLAFFGDELGDVVCDLFETNENAKTSGAGEPNLAQREGQKTHSFVSDLFGDLF